MTFWHWASINVLRFFVIFLSGIVVYLFMMQAIMMKREENPEHPTSFFTLSEVTSRGAFRVFSLLYAGSVTLLYVALAFEGGSFLGATKEALASYATQPESTLNAATVRSVFDAIPSWLNPLFVLGVFLVFFSTRLNHLIAFVRDLFANGAGLYAFTEEQATAASHDLLRKNGSSFEQSYANIVGEFREPPLPISYAGTQTEKRLSFHLIWSALPEIRDKGPANAFEIVRSRLGLSGGTSRHLSIDMSHLLASSFLFFVLMGFYVIVVPMFGGPARHLGAEWPDPNGAGWSTLILLILSYTLTLVVPLALALSMYPMRRKAYNQKESLSTSVFIVASAQWVVAFLVQEIFNLIDCAFAASHGQDMYTLFLGRIHISAFLYSLSPVVAFSLMVLLRSRIAVYGLLTATVSSVVGLHFFICDAIYEYYCPRFNYLFWHQALLGVCIMLAFFAASSVNRSMRFAEA